MSEEQLITIRDAREEDLPEILEIYNHVIVHTTSVYSEVPHTMQMRLAWYLDRVANGFPVLVAEEVGKVIGFSSLAISGFGLVTGIRLKIRFMCMSIIGGKESASCCWVRLSTVPAKWDYMP